MFALTVDTSGVAKILTTWLLLLFASAAAAAAAATAATHLSYLPVFYCRPFDDQTYQKEEQVC